MTKLIKIPEYPNWFFVFEEALAANQKPTIPVTSDTKTTPPANTQLQAPQQLTTQDKSPFSRPIEILPGKWLTNMLNILGNEVDMTIDFRVWGEVTTYHNRNYIFPTFVAQPSIFGKISPADISIKPQKGLDAMLGGKKSTDQDAAAANKIKLDKSLVPEHLRKAIMEIAISGRQKITDNLENVIPIKTISGREGQIKSSGAGDMVWKDNAIVVDRVGRLRYESENGRWLFSFEADGNNKSEGPVILLPCQMLELIEKAAGQGPATMKFRISGQISNYMNQSYMLLRKVLRVYDQDNIKKDDNKN